MDKDIRESQNYQRLDILVKGEGSSTLRHVFKNRYQLRTNCNWKDGSKFAKEFLQTYISSKKISCPEQLQKMKIANADDFDVTLLYGLIQHLDALSPGPTTQEKDLVKELVDLRNKVSHLPGKGMDSELFDQLWGQIQDVLIKLGANKERIEEIRSESSFEGIGFDSGKTAEEELAEVREKILAGDLSMKKGDYERAIKDFSSALLSKHLSAEQRLPVLSNRSNAFMQTLLTDNLSCRDELAEKCKLALADAKEVIQTDPKCWKGYFLAGQVYKYERMWMDAIGSFDVALSLNPGLTTTEIQRLRDECRFEMSKGDRKELMNPQASRLGLAQYLKSFREQRGFGPSAEFVLEEYENKLRSADPEERVGACFFFGCRYEQGIDVEQDYDKAAKMFQEAADGGHCYAMCSLGNLYAEGRGVPKDIAKGVQLIEKAANSKPVENKVSFFQNTGGQNGDIAHAQHCLGKCFEDGIGKPQDFVQAAEWYTKASANGSGAAAHNLGILYYDGHGLEQCHERAEQYWRLAASRGICLSMDCLAWMYLNDGKPELAHKWYYSSIEGGNLNSVLNEDQFLQALAQLRLEKQESHEGAKIRDDVEFIASHLGSLPISLQNDESESQEKEELLENKAHVQLTNPLRIAQVIRHREMLGSLGDENFRFAARLSAQPKLNQKASHSLSSLKEITFSEMIPTKDHIYIGRFLRLTATEDPIIGTLMAISVVAKDKNHDNLIIAFHELDPVKAKADLSFGSQFTIINPYFRIAMDGSLAVRVDDPTTLIFHPKVNKFICRYCWNENPKYSCAKCKRAQYCSKFCQNQDWKILKHKLICKAKKADKCQRQVPLQRGPVSNLGRHERPVSAGPGPEIPLWMLPYLS